MKVLIPILIGLLVVGCGKKHSGNTNESNNTPEKSSEEKVGGKTLSNNNSTTSKFEKRLRLRGEVIGEYERKYDGRNSGYVFLENGFVQLYEDGENHSISLWQISKDEELHVWKLTYGRGHRFVHRINPDGSLTIISHTDLETGKQTLYGQKEPQAWTYKKIKVPKNNNVKKSYKQIIEDIIGTWEASVDGDTVKVIFLENGTVKAAMNGRDIEGLDGWRINRNGEILIYNGKGGISLLKLETSDSLTLFTQIDRDGKRSALPKDKQPTYIKIK
jgi:hypothetical protein